MPADPPPPPPVDGPRRSLRGSLEPGLTAPEIAAVLAVMASGVLLAGGAAGAAGGGAPSAPCQRCRAISSGRS